MEARDLIEHEKNYRQTQLKKRFCQSLQNLVI